MPHEALVETFGPFLIPAVVFVIGSVGYFLLLLFSRWVGRDDRTPP